jgi:hypothetical protein
MMKFLLPFCRSLIATKDHAGATETPTEIDFGWAPFFRIRRILF